MVIISYFSGSSFATVLKFLPILFYSQSVVLYNVYCLVICYHSCNHFCIFVNCFFVIHQLLHIFFIYFWILISSVYLVFLIFNSYSHNVFDFSTWDTKLCPVSRSNEILLNKYLLINITDLNSSPMLFMKLKLLNSLNFWLPLHICSWELFNETDNKIYYLNRKSFTGEYFNLPSDRRKYWPGNYWGHIILQYSNGANKDIKIWTLFFSCWLPNCFNIFTTVFKNIRIYKH